MQAAVARFQSPRFHPSENLLDPANQIYFSLATLLYRQSFEIWPKQHPAYRQSRHKLVHHARSLLRWYTPKIKHRDEVYGHVFPEQRDNQPNGFDTWCLHIRDTKRGTVFTTVRFSLPSQPWRLRVRRQSVQAVLDPPSSLVPLFLRCHYTVAQAHGSVPALLRPWFTLQEHLRDVLPRALAQTCFGYLIPSVCATEVRLDAFACPSLAHVVDVLSRMPPDRWQRVHTLVFPDFGATDLLPFGSPRPWKTAAASAISICRLAASEIQVLRRCFWPSGKFLR